MTEAVLEAPKYTVAQLDRIITDEKAVTDAFKKGAAFEGKLGEGEWVEVESESGNYYKLTLPSGSTVTLKLFDTVKQIFNSKLVAIPGRESFLSYLDISVMPKGAKGYTFLMDLAQHTWGTAKLKATAGHQASVAKLVEKVAQLGITDPSFKTYYVGKL